MCLFSKVSVKVYALLNHTNLNSSYSFEYFLYNNSLAFRGSLKLDPLVACASVFRASSPAEKPRKRRRNLQSSVQRQRGGLRLADLFSLWVFLHFPCLHLSVRRLFCWPNSRNIFLIFSFPNKTTSSLPDRWCFLPLRPRRQQFQREGGVLVGGHANHDAHDAPKSFHLFGSHLTL